MKTLNWTLILSVLLLNQTTFAQDFSPMKKETTQFKLWSESTFNHGSTGNYERCKFESRFSQDSSAIELRMGIEGSNYDYFGWDMNIPLSDFPLKDGYHAEFKPAGGTWMALDYRGNKLSLSFMKKNGLWTMIFPFELVIDANLTDPKSFNGTVAGFDKDLFGNPKKHMTQKCTF